MIDKFTTLGLKESVKEALRKEKISPEETWNDVLKRLVGTTKTPRKEKLQSEKEEVTDEELEGGLL